MTVTRTTEVVATSTAPLYAISLSSPLYLILVILSLISWILLVIGFADITHNTGNAGPEWFYIVLDFLVIMSLIFLPVFNAIGNYRLALLVFMTIVVIWLYGACNFVNASGNGFGQTIGSGAVIQSVALSLLMIIIGSETNSRVYYYVSTNKQRGANNIGSNQNLNP